MAFSLLGVVSTVGTTVLAGSIGLAIQNAFKTLKKFNKLSMQFIETKKDTEAKLCDVRKDVDLLRDNGKTSDTRLTKVEDAISDIRNAVQKSDEQYANIIIKLEQLTRINAVLDSMSVAIAAIVPRNEVEIRMSGVEKRIERVEQDVRTSGRS